MTYLAAAVAVACHVDPMVVLEWPPDVFQAVCDTLAGRTPAHQERQFAQLMAFANAGGGGDA